MTVFLDYAGFISTISSATSKTGNEYINIKLWTKIDEYKTISIMISHNSTIKDSYLKTLQSAIIPLKISKAFATDNGTIFFKTFHGSKI